MGLLVGATLLNHTYKTCGMGLKEMGLSVFYELLIDIKLTSRLYVRMIWSLNGVAVSYLCLVGKFTPSAPDWYRWLWSCSSPCERIGSCTLLSDQYVSVSSQSIKVYHFDSSSIHASKLECLFSSSLLLLLFSSLLRWHLKANSHESVYLPE